MIHWPSGIVQKFTHVQLNQYLSITETQTPSEPQLSVDPERLNLGYSGVQASFQIHNSGGGQLNWQIDGNWNAPWISGISPLSGTNDGQVTVQIDRTDLTAGIYRKTLHITSNGGEDSLKIIVKVSSPENFNLRMVAGGQDYIDRAGELWRADQPYTPGDWGYVGGKVNVEKDSIKNTTDPYLYQTERYGLNAYKFDVPDGRYTVILHFAEIYWHQSGKRIFNVSVEDSLVLDHYDIFAEVGADYATIHAYTAKVSDGLLTIDFKTIQDNSEITAIEIIGLSTPNFPVELTSLNAALMGANQIRLEWSTKTETNNLGFEIERKYENKDFKKIGFVNGNGTSNNPQYYEFRDRVDEMGDYTYRLKQIDLNGLFKYSSEARVTVAAPPNIIVLQNYPNPFNNSTLIQYSVPEKFSGQTVKLTIYDITGDIVKETTRNKTKAGEYDFRWDGTDENDHPVASGLFFYRLKVGPIEKFSRMILLK
ncbi:flagellar basal body rod modification protein [bacterium BMS3Bbin03]|nr:flagellar basal body rod modification protein [bacterium BMS3Bbin03]